MSTRECESAVRQKVSLPHLSPPNQIEQDWLRPLLLTAWFHRMGKLFRMDSFGLLQLPDLYPVTLSCTYQQELAVLDKAVFVHAKENGFTLQKKCEYLLIGLGYWILYSLQAASNFQNEGKAP